MPDLLDAIERLLPSGHTLEVFLWDYQRQTITGVRSGRSADRPGTAEVVEGSDAVRPLQLHGEPIGLLAVWGSALSSGFIDRLADVLALSVRSSEVVSDVVAVRRRTRSMSLPAEMQWRVLPPGQFLGRGARISAAVEPAYDTGGDTYDYSLIDGRLFVAILDARGHGLRAATTASVVTSAMRRARRNGDGLLVIAEEMHASIGALGDEDEFVSTVLVEFDVDTWNGRWLSAGHLAPLIVTDEVRMLESEPTLPLGMVIRGNSPEPVVQDIQLEYGQTLVLYSDGVIDNAADDAGQPVGEQRFHRALLDRAGTDGGEVGQVARAVVDDLLALTGPELRDDATIVMVDRLPPTELV